MHICFTGGGTIFLSRAPAGRSGCVKHRADFAKNFSMSGENALLY